MMPMAAKLCIMVPNTLRVRVKPAVEHGQAGQHEQHEGAADEHPGGIPRVQHRRRSSSLFLGQDQAGYT